jgi:HAD superfamily phosphoserine phosphatase-like hydrolase
MKPLFVFDLDSTITKCELLPLIAEGAGLGDEMTFLTEKAMQGKVPFEQDFRNRVALLKNVPVSRTRSIAARMPLHEKIADFIRKNPERCIIMTGNLDVWIAPIIEKLGMKGRCICSQARVCEDCLLGIASVLDKGVGCKKLPHPFVAIGDGSNDTGMLKTADIGIAFGGARKPPDELISAADMVVWDENELIEILEKLL